MWRELVAALFDDVKFNAPARPEDLKIAEERLRVALPEELKALLLESNGLAAYYGTPFVRSTDEIVSQNLLFRQQPEFRDLYAVRLPVLLRCGREWRSVRLLDPERHDPADVRDLRVGPRE
jgi:hypothetical protein